MNDEFAFAGNFNFLVEIASFDDDARSVVGGFAEVDGIGARSDVLEYRVGSQALAMKLPGRTHYGNIRLRRGVTTSTALWDWRARVEKGESDLRDGSIILLDSAMRERTRWNFYGAWPSAYEAPRFDADGDGLSIETIELAVQRVERVDP